MKTFEMKYSNEGVSLLEVQVLYDAKGNPVSSSNHRVSVGLGDHCVDVLNPTVEELDSMRVSITSKLTPFMSEQMANTIADIKIKDDELKVVKVHNEMLRQETEKALGLVAKETAKRVAAEARVVPDVVEV